MNGNVLRLRQRVPDHRHSIGGELALATLKRVDETRKHIRPRRVIRSIEHGFRRRDCGSALSFIRVRQRNRKNN